MPTKYLVGGFKNQTWSIQLPKAILDGGVLSSLASPPPAGQ